MNKNDIELIQEILSGNKLSENELYNRYKDVIYFYINQNYPNNKDIQDDVSDVLVKIFSNLKVFDEKKSKFKSWVITVCKNHMIDKWRCKSITCVSFSEFEKDNGYDYTYYSSDNDDNFSNIGRNELYDITFKNETYNIFDLAANCLSQSDYNLLDMKYNQGYNYKEIGDEFNLTSSTVSNKVNYIKTKLKKSLNT